MTTKELMARATTSRIDAKPNKDKYRYIGVRKMSFKEFAALPDYPVQRDHARRAPHAVHLHTFEPRHRKAAAGILPDGVTYKLDGHTRTFCWLNGLTENLPDNLTLDVEVWEVLDPAQEVIEHVYDTFDSPLSVDNASDSLYGALRKEGIELQSHMMQRCLFNSSLRQLYILIHGYPPKGMTGAAVTRRMVEFFRDEIVTFDRLNPRRNDYLTAVVTAALLTLLADPVDALRFWRAFNNNEGTKTAAGFDGVQSVHNLVGHLRRRKLQRNQVDLEVVGRCINAFQHWKAGGRYSAKRGREGIPETKGDKSFRDFIDRAVARKALP